VNCAENLPAQNRAIDRENLGLHLRKTAQEQKCAALEGPVAMSLDQVLRLLKILIEVLRFVSDYYHDC